MDTISPIFWVVTGLALIIAEMFSLSLVLLFFGISALLVAIAKYAGLNNVPAEIALFAVAGIAGMFLFRKKLRHTLQSSKGMSIDRNTPVVLSADVPAQGSAEVVYQGALWTAVNETAEVLKKGTKAYIHGTDGVKLIVKSQPLSNV